MTTLHLSPGYCTSLTFNLLVSLNQHVDMLFPYQMSPNCLKSNQNNNDLLFLHVELLHQIGKIINFKKIKINLNYS